MKAIFGHISWKFCLKASVAVLCVLIVLNFYGLYTNKFYLVKMDNYIFPMLSIVHFMFLYVMSLKIKAGEYTDPPMRNLEYALYVISLVYIFKLVDTFYIVLSYDDYANHIIPPTFLPIGLTMVLLQLALIYLTCATFHFRRELVGSYNFDQINENIDPWP